MPDLASCHCGAEADGHLDGYCRSCSDVRCDAYPGTCAPPSGFMYRCGVCGSATYGLPSTEVADRQMAQHMRAAHPVDGYAERLRRLWRRGRRTAAKGR